MNDTTVKIMIADDDADDLQLLRFLFHHHPSFEVVSYHNSGDSVSDEIINQGNVPDILLTDMFMPKMTGTEIADLLSNQGFLDRMHLFIISTTIHEQNQEKYESNNKISFLKKPITLAEINDLPELLLEKLQLKNIYKI